MKKSLSISSLKKRAISTLKKDSRSNSDLHVMTREPSKPQLIYEPSKLSPKAANVAKPKVKRRKVKKARRSPSMMVREISLEKRTEVIKKDKD